jgi:hypothetical protein
VTRASHGEIYIVGYELKSVEYIMELNPGISRLSMVIEVYGGKAAHPQEGQAAWKVGRGSVPPGTFQGYSKEVAAEKMARA